MDKRGFFAADKGAGAVFQLDIEVKTAAEDVLAQQAGRGGLFDGLFQPCYGQRVFGAYVDKPGVRAYGVAAYGHGFEHGMRVAFEHGAVHKGPRVALIGVTDDVFLPLRLCCGKLPFFAGGEATAAATA